jgi:hypothetical protein
VLQAAASNINSFLQRDTCLSLIQLKKLLLIATGGLLHLENCDLQEVFLSKTNTILTVNNELHAPATNTVAFLSRYPCLSSTQLNRPFWGNISLPPR